MARSAQTLQVVRPPARAPRTGATRAAGNIDAASDTPITQRIVDGLRLELSPDEQAGLAQPATVNAEAYEEFLRGRDRFARFIFRTVAAADCDAAGDRVGHKALGDLP